jgi:hypothetical protein
MATLLHRKEEIFLVRRQARRGDAIFLALVIIFAAIVEPLLV